MTPELPTSIQIPGMSLWTFINGISLIIIVVLVAIASIKQNRIANSFAGCSIALFILGNSLAAAVVWTLELDRKNDALLKRTVAALRAERVEEAKKVEQLPEFWRQTYEILGNKSGEKDLLILMQILKESSDIPKVSYEQIELVINNVRYNGHDEVFELLLSYLDLSDWTNTVHSKSFP